MAANPGNREAATRLGVQFAIRVLLAHVGAAVAALLVIISLSRNTIGDARDLLTPKNLIAFAALVAVSAVVDAIAGMVNIHPSFRWFAAGQPPTAAQKRAALRIAGRQTLVHFAIWVISGAVLVLINLDSGGGVAIVIGAAILFGAATTACVSYLITQRTLRPIIAASMEPSKMTVEAPGVLSRLVIVWVLFSALPSLAIVLIALARSNGWFVQKAATVEEPILAVAGVSLILGLGGLVLVARSISDPVREVVKAMNAVEHGQPDAAVAVYELSEIGHLQTGFNRMMAGLAERERLRDLFGRHVGADVARFAIERDAAIAGDVRDAGIVYVDLVGSTTMAASRPPQEVAQVLNTFFRIVVAAVDEQHGLINKFQGDAVLAIFGAPLPVDNPASAALAAARTLARELSGLPDIDFGVGVSAGSVFAGNVGAENRYEYTVIGDPVNEAARLADQAKNTDSRVLASGAATATADAKEQARWVSRGSMLLRGRSTPTELAEPLVID